MKTLFSRMICATVMSPQIPASLCACSWARRFCRKRSRIVVVEDLVICGSLKKLILFLSWSVLGTGGFFGQVQLGGLAVQRGDFGEFMFLGDAFETFMLASDPILEARAFKRY